MSHNVLSQVQNGAEYKRICTIEQPSIYDLGTELIKVLCTYLRGHIMTLRTCKLQFVACKNCCTFSRLSHTPRPDWNRT